MGYKVNKRYVGTNLVRPSGWKPGENTLFYLPLENDILDHSGKGVSITYSGTQNFQNPGILLNSRIDVGYSQVPSSFTFAGFFKTTASNTTFELCRQASITSSGYYGYDLCLNANNRANTVRVEFLKYQYSNVWQQFWNIDTTKRHHFFLIVENNTLGYLYVDNILKGSKSISGRTKWNGTFTIGLFNDGYAGEVIFEDKARTQQERTDYFERMKGKFGIQ